MRNINLLDDYDYMNDKPQNGIIWDKMYSKLRIPIKNKIRPTISYKVNRLIKPPIDNLLGSMTDNNPGNERIIEATNEMIRMQLNYLNL